MHFARDHIDLEDTPQYQNTMLALRTALVPLLLLPFLAIAQPSTDITLVNTGTGELEVRIRPTGDFDGFFAASVFTLRWLDASGVTPGEVVNQLPGSIHYVSESGEMAIEGIYRYQIYAGFGNVPLSNSGSSWTANEEVLLCTIPVPVDGTTYEIVEDDWTEMNNGDFYLSFNGVAVGGGTSGGGIYNISTAISSEELSSMISIAPNPTNGITWVELAVSGNEMVQFSLLDATGRSIWTKSSGVSSGPVRFPIDLTGFAEGAYTLSMRSGEAVSFYRIVNAR